MASSVKEMISTLTLPTNPENPESDGDEGSLTMSVDERPSPPATPTNTVAEDKTLLKREHAKLYQREYRQRQKNQLHTLKESQIRGAEILLVSAGGEITSRILKTEADYIDMLEGFLQALKDSKYLISYRLSKVM